MKAELFDMVGQVGQGESCVFPLVQIVQLEGLKVTDQDVARTLAFGQSVEIFPGLAVGFIEVAAGTLLFDQQHAGPEQVNITG